MSGTNTKRIEEMAERIMRQAAILGRADGICAHLGKVCDDDDRIYITATNGWDDPDTTFVVRDDYGALHATLDTLKDAAEVAAGFVLSHDRSVA